MFDVDKILETLRTDPEAQKTAKTAGAGVAAGLAASMLMGRRGRKFLGKAAQLGALAAIGGLAYQAWRRRNGGDAFDADYGAAGGNTPFLPPAEDKEANLALGQALIRAMIAAAKADGKIDAAEKARIFERLEAMDLTSEEKAFVFDELAGPLDIEAVAAAARSPEQAAEVYAASLVAIEADGPQEAAYLERLAARLGLEDALVAEIHAVAG